MRNKFFIFIFIFLFIQLASAIEFSYTPARVVLRGNVSQETGTELTLINPSDSKLNITLEMQGDIKGGLDNSQLSLEENQTRKIRFWIVSDKAGNFSNEILIIVSDGNLSTGGIVEILSIIKKPERKTNPLIAWLGGLLIVLGLIIFFVTKIKKK